MSDAIKWALLVAGALIVIALIMTLPFVNFIDFDSFSSAITSLVEVCGDALHTARGFINNFFSPFGRTVLTGLMFYLLCKWLITYSIKITIWIYHFIFK